VGATGLGDSWALRWAWQLVGARVGVSSSRDKLAAVDVRVGVAYFLGSIDSY